jgi:predicted MFS family arabinose efflux permease
MFFKKMNALERRSVLVLSIIMALRMLGLFMVLPLFALYASTLPDATPWLIGLSMGIYGLTQALLQIPFGALSDKIGRKKIIAMGLLIFMAGSIVAAMSHTIWGVFIGRALQGAGAVGGTLLALIADLTREEQRTKAMAVAGMTIGFSFMLSIILGPLFASWIQVNGIFWLAALFSFIALCLLIALIPEPERIIKTEDLAQNFFSLLKHQELMRLNAGIFILHAVFTASFVVIPIALQNMAHLNGNQQWFLYLPVLMLAFLISVPCLLIAEKWQRVKPFFLGGIILLALAELLLWFFASNLLLSALSLLLFFTAFSLLEAFLPSLVSRTAPAARKGTALGIYSFSQFFGIFIGGACGGWLYGSFGLTQVNLFCALLTIIWLGIAFRMKNPQYANHRHSS